MQIVSYLEYMKILQHMDCLKLNNIPVLYQNCIKLHNDRKKQQLQQPVRSLQANNVLLNSWNWCEFQPEMMRFIVDSIGHVMNHHKNIHLLKLLIYF